MDTLTLADAIKEAPAIAAENPAESVSKRYQFVSTKDVIAILTGEGWSIIKAFQANSKKYASSSRHVVVMKRRTTDEMLFPNCSIELLVDNSHDALSSFRLHLAVKHDNAQVGFIIKSQPGAFVKRHIGEWRVEVIQLATQMYSLGTKVISVISQLSKKKLSIEEKKLLVERAIIIRYHGIVEASHYPINVQTVYNTLKNSENLWSDMLKIQEGLIQGGLKTESSSKGRRTKTRPVSSLLVLMHFNKVFFETAIDMFLSEATLADLVLDTLIEEV